MAERTPFVCRECSRRVSSTSYRATCPECGGTLGPASVAVSTGRPRSNVAND